MAAVMVRLQVSMSPSRGILGKKAIKNEAAVNLPHDPRPSSNPIEGQSPPPTPPVESLITIIGFQMVVNPGDQCFQGFFPKKFIRLLCPALGFDDKPPPVEVRFLSSFEGPLLSLEDRLFGFLFVDGLV